MHADQPRPSTVSQVVGVLSAVAGLVTLVVGAGYPTTVVLLVVATVAAAVPVAEILVNHWRETHIKWLMLWLPVFLGLTVLTTVVVPRPTSAHPSSGRPLAKWFDLHDVSMRIGSKEFVEQRVLGQIAIQTLRAAGADVTDHTNLGGTDTVRTALEDGRIDGYFEYTGTAWLEIFGHRTPLRDAEEQLVAVRETDKANGLTWLRHSAASNSYAIAASETAMREHSISTISDYAGLVRRDPDAAALCVTAEFATRSDGLPGLERRYGFDLPPSQVATLHPDEVHREAVEGERCRFASVFNTAGELASGALTVLDDDLEFFPLYNAAMVMRTEKYEGAHQGDYGKLFGEIAPRLTQDALRELNARVIRGEEPAAVAGDFLRREGII